MTADLTDSEIDAICAGLRQSAAKVRFLKSLGLRVHRKPNGAPLVNRAHYDDVRGVGNNALVSAANGPAWGVHR